MKCSIIVVLLISSVYVNGQVKTIEPDLTNIDTSVSWVLHGREFTTDKGINFNSKPEDGLLWLKEINFKNGTIELDVKGKNEKGKSFVGIAFHGLNDSVYDVVYFRAFNFNSPDRKNHAIQYISHPEHTWWSLRKQYPEIYESDIKPIPNPDDWFHVTLEVAYPVVKAYVNNSPEPSLTINQLSNRKMGWVGFWAGYGSEGSYKNLKIIHKL